VGFAVPVNMARFVMDRLVRFGKVTRGFLGINIQSLTPGLAREFNLPDQSSGVLVGGVNPNSPAAKAGLKDGDLILELEGKKVPDPRTLQLAVAQNAPGTTVTLRVLRGEPGGKSSEHNLQATLGELPQEALANTANKDRDERSPSNLDALEGVEVTDLDSTARRQADIPRSVHGALVVTVEADSMAAEAGLREGDVIVEINHQPVRNADDAVSLSEKAKDNKDNRVLLRVWGRADGGPAGTRYVAVQRPKQK
jgi:serine protease Do